MGDLEKILIMALEMENRARDFYLGQLDKVEDPRVRTTLQWLADWEQEHADLIQARLEGREGPALGREAPDQTLLPEREKEERDPSRVALELTTLRVALNMERDARDFYTAAAVKAEEGRERELFQTLARIEEGHWQLLEGSYQDLSQEYWADMGFAPF
jgi:rubrerythrin